MNGEDPGPGPEEEYQPYYAAKTQEILEERGMEPEEAREISGAPAPPPEPTPPPKPEEAPLLVTKTSGEDRYIVRQQLKDAPVGEYHQTIMSQKQIEAVGGRIPTVSEAAVRREPGQPTPPPPKAPPPIPALPPELAPEEEFRPDIAARTQALLEKRGMTPEEARAFTVPPTPGVKITPETHIEVGRQADGRQWMLRKDVEGIKENYPFQYDILLKYGYDPFIKAMGDVDKAAQERYDVAQAKYIKFFAGLEPWKESQRKQGYSEEDIARHLKEIESGTYKVYDPESDKFVAAYRETVEAREEAGLTPQELREISSGKYLVYDPRTDKFVATTKAMVEARERAGLTPQELREIDSGKYKVYDYATGTFVPVTKAMYEKREEFYSTLPPTAVGKVGPPGTPGVVVGVPGYAAAVGQIKEFVIPNPNPKPGEPEEVVDLVSAIKSKVPDTTMELFFPKEAIDWAKEVVRVEEQAASVQEAEKYYRDRWWDLSTGKIINGAERDAILSEDPNAPIVKAQPALVLAADPEWAKLKDLPKDDPKRQAYQKLWGQKVFDTAAFATMVAAPWISTAFGVGAAGIATLMLRPLPLAVKAIPLVPKVVSFIPRIASGLAQLAVIAGPPTHLAARAVDEQKLLYYDKKWEEFQKVPTAEKEKLAVLAGYRQGYSKLNDAEKANVLVHHAPPPELTSAQALGFVAEKNEWMQAQAAKGGNWIVEKAPGPGHVATFAGGAVVGVVEGVGYAASLPLALSYLSSGVSSGTGKETASMIAIGIATFFTTELPKAVKANPALGIGRIGGLFIMSPLTLAKLAKGFGYSLPRSTWATMGRAISISFETLRIPKAGLKATPAQMMRLGEEIVKQLITKGTSKVEAKFGEWAVRVRNIPFQQVVGDVMFTFADSKFYPKGQSISVGMKTPGLDSIPYHYMAPTATPRFGVLSAKGERITNSVLVVTHLHPEYKVEIGKTLAKGVELESTMGITSGVRRPGILDPIMKPDGTPLTGRGWHADVGDYTILHYMIRGEEPTWKTLTLKQQEQIATLAAKEALLDFTLGWHGRAQALKGELKANPKVKNLDKALQEVRQWKEEGNWDNFGPADRLYSMRDSVPHPESGMMNTRVRMAVFDDRGRILLTLDKSATAYDLPGGAISFKRQLTVEKGWHPTKPGELTGGKAAASQVLGETLVNVGDIGYVGTYGGKWNPYSLAGTRLYEGRALNPSELSPKGAFEKYQRPAGDVRPELTDAKFWDGHTEIKVETPAAYDALAYWAHRRGWDMSKVTISKVHPELFVSRDTGFVKRITEGRDLTGKELIAFATKAELRALRNWTARVHRIREPSVLDWIFGENDLSTFGMLLLGRRKVVDVMKQKGKLSPEDAVKIAKEHPEIMSKEAVASLKEIDVQLRRALKKATAEERVNLEAMAKDLREGVYETEVNRFAKKSIESFENYQAAIDRAYEYSHSRGEYGRSYVSTLGKVLVAGFGYAYPGRTPALSRAIGLPYAAAVPEYAYPEERPFTLRDLVGPIYPVPITPEKRLYAPAYSYPAPEYPPSVIVTPRYEKLEYPEPKYPPPPEYPEPKYPPPPEYPPPDYPPPPPPPPPEVTKGKPRVVEVPPGSIAWRQGKPYSKEQIKYIPPPYDQSKPISLLDQQPRGWIDKGRTPAETMQIIGEARDVPHRISIDLGIADIVVVDGKTIEFTGGGLKTDVGTRLPSPTKGMSIGGIAAQQRAELGEVRKRRPIAAKPKPLPPTPTAAVKTIIGKVSDWA